VEGSRLGDYEIERILGRGGFGVVYVGVHVDLKRRAAIKQLLPAFSRDRHHVERFFNEARAAASIDHPGIVEIYDVGWHTDGSAFFAMKLLDGDSLARRLRARGQLSIAAATTIARQVANAVGAAHARQIIHRDLKPDNIILVRDAEVAAGERAVVVDFGIAKLVDNRDAGTSTTADGTVLGTPLYMSPEQCRGAAGVDHRSDIYALGCILFEMLAGRPPHVGRSSGEVVGMHQFVDPPALSSLRPDAAALDPIIARCLAKEPKARYQNLTELAAALEPHTRGTNDAPREVAPPPAVDALAETVSSIEARAPKPRRSRVVVLGAAAVAALGVGTFFALDTSRRGKTPSPPPAADAATPDGPPLDAIPRTSDNQPDYAQLRNQGNYAALRALCRDHEVNRRWNELNECGGYLKDGDAETGKRYQEIGSHERSAVQNYEKLLRELKDGKISDVAYYVSRAIPPESVYFADAVAAVRREMPLRIDKATAKLRPFTKDCVAYDKAFDELRHEQTELFALLVAARVPCTDKAFTLTARPDDECDFDADREEGWDLFIRGSHAQAATLFAHALKCLDGEPNLTRFAVAACLAKRDASQALARLPRFSQLALEPACKR
jgi:serine/threonine protein kinase